MEDKTEDSIPLKADTTSDGDVEIQADPEEPSSPVEKGTPAQDKPQDVPEDEPEDDLEDEPQDIPLVEESAVDDTPTRPSLKASYRSVRIKHDSCFTDEKGNLKFVNFLCRNPFKIFFGTLLLMILCTALLVVILVQAGGTFLTDLEPTTYFEVGDVRSQAYYNLRLASDEVMEDRNIDNVVLPQSENIENIFWLWESESDNIFGNADSIKSMKQDFDLIYADQEFPEYCLKEYRVDEGVCVAPISPTDIYYATSWDFDKVANVIEQLQQDDAIELFNTIYNCVCDPNDPIQQCTQDKRCDNLNNELIDENRNWILEMYGDIFSIITQWDGKGELVAEDKLDQVTLFSAYLGALDMFKSIVEVFYDKDFDIDNPVSKYSRARIEFGGPHTTYDDDTPDKDDDKKAVDKLVGWIEDNFYEKMTEIVTSNYHSTIDSFFSMGSLMGRIALDSSLKDNMNVQFSLQLVAFIIFLGTGSIWLAIVGMLQIFYSVPVAWFINRAIFQIQMFSGINLVSLFIVAAIGADDIFVFMDAYKQSAFMGDILESFESRMSYVYRRAGSAMLVTSSTTFVAFLCTAITPIPAIQSFGIFAAFVILIDYALVMSLFTSAVVIYHNKFEGRPYCSCVMGGCCVSSDPTPTEIVHQRAIGWARASSIKQASIKEGNAEEETPEAPKGLKEMMIDALKCIFFIQIEFWKACTGKNNRESTAGTTADNNTIVPEIEEAEGEPISLFFRDKFSKFVLNPIARSIIGVVLVTWLGVSIYFMSQLKASINPDQGLRSSHPAERANNILFNEFTTSSVDQRLEIFFSWGVDLSPNTKGVNALHDPSFYGEAAFVDTFNFDEQCQSSLLDLCYEIEENEEASGHISSVKCVMKEFAAFIKFGSLDNCDAVRRADLRSDMDWPVSKEELPTKMKAFLDENTCENEFARQRVVDYYETEVGWDGEEMKYASIQVESSVLGTGPTSRSETEVEYDAMIKLANIFDKAVSETCGSPTSMTDLSVRFMVMNTQRRLMKGAIQSTIIAIAIAFAVLFVFTKSLHVSVFATLSIMAILISVTGVMQMAGWTIGTIEAILITILVGFSVDYVVHLAHAYVESEGDVETRVIHAFGEMGVSVLNGMLTSIFASIPMFFAQSVFYIRFAFFLCFTILFSWIFANLGFMSLLVTCKIPIKRGKWGFGL